MLLLEQRTETIGIYIECCCVSFVNSSVLNKITHIRVNTGHSVLVKGPFLLQDTSNLFVYISKVLFTFFVSQARKVPKRSRSPL